MSQTSMAQTPTEKAEQRLADLLAPGGGKTLKLFAVQPVAWPGSAVVENISVPMKPFAFKPARLSVAAAKEVKPRAVPEGTPLVSYREALPPPEPMQLPATALIRLPSVDVQSPLPIPILAQPVTDRASLGDPALEASLGAALKPLTPTRTSPVPFVPLNLPDPFENVRTGQIRNPPDENPIPPAIPLTRPTAK